MPSIRSLLPVLWKKSGGVCALCLWALDPKKLDVDHIIPTSRGGTDEESNLQVVHHLCNIRKGNRPMDEAVVRIRTIPAVSTATNGKTLISFQIPQELFDRLEDYRFANRWASRGALIKALIQTALERYGFTAPQPD